MAKKRIKKKKFWMLKIFVITLVIAGGISVVTESLMGNLPIFAAAFIILAIMMIGITFDIIGIAFASCDQAPFVSMASKKIQRAKSAIKLLQNADIVSNICGDVIGDICGIVSGAAGAAIALKIASEGPDKLIWGIAVSSLIAAMTVAGKAAGKSFAIRKNREIVGGVAYLLMFFMKEGRKDARNARKDTD